MASNISLGYHQLAETKVHNRATEAETTRANNLLDTRTREIADADRAFNYYKVGVEDTRADRDRRSRETIATKDRTSRETIASKDRSSKERIAEADRFNQRSMNNERMLNNLEVADKQTDREINKILTNAMASGEWQKMLGAQTAAAIQSGDESAQSTYNATLFSSLGADTILPTLGGILKNLIGLVTGKSGKTGK